MIADRTEQFEGRATTRLRPFAQIEPEWPRG